MHFIAVARWRKIAVFIVLLAVVIDIMVSVSSVSAQEPPPRPTLEPTAVPTSIPREEEDDLPTPESSGRIIGTVIDQTTGAPAPAIAVQVGDAIVTSDANGNYQRVELPAGQYTVALVLAPDQGTPAQPQITIELAAGATVVQHLAFRSQPHSTPTATIVPTTVSAPGASPTSMAVTPTSVATSAPAAPSAVAATMPILHEAAPVPVASRQPQVLPMTGRSASNVLGLLVGFGMFSLGLILRIMIRRR